MEYTALYRRFRPKTFEEVVGQDHITTTLKNQVIADRVGHAYLLTGCRGCGKTSTAKILARAINCLNPRNGEPCNECSICKSAIDGSLTDIVEMDAASNNSVDDIRNIRDEVNFLPTIAKYRVYIIDEVHMLSTGAFNALLKTLEEPPKHVKFILATTEPQKLPATILSRCQRFDFKKISEKNIVSNLEKICNECEIKYTQEALNLIAELAEGALRDALSILERCAQDGENNINENKIKDLAGIPPIQYIAGIAEKIINYDAEGVIEITEQVINEGKDVNNLLWEMIKYFRDILLLITTKQISNIYSEKDIEFMQQQASKTEKGRLLKIIYSLSELENDIKYSSQKNIVFQVGILKLCGKEGMSLEERIIKLEESIKNGIVVTANQKEMKQSTSRAQNVNNSIQNQPKIANNQVKSTQSSLKTADFWSNVIGTLKEQRMPMLYSNLLNTKGVLLDDMTVGIQFPNGLNSFGKSVIERPENMAELKRLVSIECKKDMRIKLIDEKATKNNKTNDSNENTEDTLNLGININMIDE